MATLPRNHDFLREMDVAVSLVSEVAAEVNRVYEARSAADWSKGDGSPVTDADLLADRMIREGLAAAFPEDARLTEESEDTPSRLANPRCWIADPIDGTAQFVARTGNFDVMLALVVDGRTHLAVCGHPPSGTLVVAILDGGTWLIRPDGDAERVMLASPTDPPELSTSVYYAPDEHAAELAAVAETLGTETPEVRSSGYGPRSLMPGWRDYDAFVGFWKRSGDSPVREWDLAACDLITTEAGGAFTDLYGNRYRYNQPSPRPRAGLLVAASPRLHQRLVEALAPLLPEHPDAANRQDQELTDTGTRAG
jgi:3'-phosphoadenosine 5'-phosphosulfate (PAPS) 3'-phosphatase